MQIIKLLSAHILMSLYFARGPINKFVTFRTVQVFSTVSIFLISLCFYFNRPGILGIQWIISEYISREIFIWGINDIKTKLYVFWFVDFIHLVYITPKNLLGVAWNVTMDIWHPIKLYTAAFNHLIIPTNIVTTDKPSARKWRVRLLFSYARIILRFSNI